MNCNLKSAIYIYKKVNPTEVHYYAYKIKEVFSYGDTFDIIRFYDVFIFNFYFQRNQVKNFANIKNDCFKDWKQFVSKKMLNVEFEILQIKASRSKYENLNDVSFNLFAFMFW